MDSYSLPGFAEFYDELVAVLPEEYEPGKDVGLYWRLLARTLEERGSATVLDLCTGSGRVVRGLADHLARSQHQERQPGEMQHAVRLVGVDSSLEMLRAAERKLAPSSLPPGVSCEWLHGDMAALPSAEELGGPMDLVIISAGSFHHLLTKEAQRACLSGVRRLLAAHPAARAVINLLPSSHLHTHVGSVTLAGPFRRTCLEVEKAAQPDGGTVWRQQFLLARLGAAPGRSDGWVTAEWEQEEGWALREVEPEEFRGLLQGESGLEVEEQREGFGNSADSGSSRKPGWGGPGRVFVLRRNLRSGA